MEKSVASDPARQDCRVTWGLIPPAIVRKDQGHVGGIRSVKRWEVWLSLVPGTSRKNPWPQWREAAGRWKAEGFLPSARPWGGRSDLRRGLGGDRVGTGWGLGGVAYVPATEESLLCVHTSHLTFHELKHGFCQKPQCELPKVLDDVVGPSPAAWPPLHAIDLPRGISGQFPFYRPAPAPTHPIHQWVLTA